MHEVLVQFNGGFDFQALYSQRRIADRGFHNEFPVVGILLLELNHPYPSIFF